MNIVDVDASNVNRYGFFCKMSQRKSTGYQNKSVWLEHRFIEGLRIKMLDLEQGGRGFVEYIPAEYAWRPVYADGYLFIHCLWVVGQSKGKGYGRMLLDACVEEARTSGKHGVVMVTSEGNWLAGRKLLAGAGFEEVDRAAPAFSLMVKKFGSAPDPYFPSDWDERARQYGDGLTIICTDQCPYVDDAVAISLKSAAGRGIPSRVVRLSSAREVRERAPSPYGVYGVVLDGRLLTYHYLLEKELSRVLPV